MGRYGQFRPEEADGASTRLSIGGGWVLQEGVEVRVEQQINGDGADLSLMQLAVGF